MNVYEIDCVGATEWIIAESEQDALQFLAEQLAGEGKSWQDWLHMNHQEADEYEVKQLDPDIDFSIADWDTLVEDEETGEKIPSRTTMTIREWIEKEGCGFLASTEY